MFHEALKGRAGAGEEAGPRSAGALLCDIGPVPLYLGAGRPVPLLAAETSLQLPASWVLPARSPGGTGRSRVRDTRSLSSRGEADTQPDTAGGSLGMGPAPASRLPFPSSSARGPSPPTRLGTPCPDSGSLAGCRELEGSPVSESKISQGLVCPSESLGPRPRADRSPVGRHPWGPGPESPLSSDSGDSTSAGVWNPKRRTPDTPGQLGGSAGGVPVPVLSATRGLHAWGDRCWPWRVLDP